MRRLSPVLYLVVAVLMAVAGIYLSSEQTSHSAVATKPPSRVKTDTNPFLTTCATCHGKHGEGNREVSAPAIASLPEWYLRLQVENFRTGKRGTHVDDSQGKIMRDTLLSLEPAAIDEALAYLLTLPAVKIKSSIQGDLKNGAYLYREHCMECHRYNGRGEVVFKSAPLVGLQDWYLLAQWDKFKSGTRGYHTDDESGAKMRKTVSYLKSDQDVRDVILYISTLTEKHPKK
ncbi:MAG: c-type cytochrome [Akkermansiaceae bacterium]